MPRQNVFIKISGDLFERNSVLHAIAVLTQEYFVVVCIGGGTQINDTFQKRGFDLGKHGPLGRETNTFEERQVARDVLERNKAALQDLLADRKIPATVIIPVLELGSVLSHVNGDTMIEAAYLGFDQLYVYTQSDRVQKKLERFERLPKVQVIGFSE
ncbi:hypothetical protein GF380_00250 [Candidatus Uhrbacteria bacterium]|nr:hypothetical protein [Candidatus Uhrbacteria bacterium]MBD3283851.1 hypothetical protein [Candidatus Uhrbacteria bacterium]